MANKIQLLTLSARRGKNGAIFSAKVDPVIEEFFKQDSMRTDETTPRTSTTTGCFTNVGYGEDPTVDPLRFYAQNNGLTLAGPGSYNGAVTERRSNLTDGGYANLSWLRIPGISGENGVTFFAQGVFPADMIREYLEQASTMVQRFYNHHIAQYSFSVSLTVEKNF